MNKHLTTWSQSIKLKEIGISQENRAFYMGEDPEGEPGEIIIDADPSFFWDNEECNHTGNFCAGFLLSELIEILGEGFEGVTKSPDDPDFVKWRAYGYWAENYHVSYSPISAFEAAYNLILKLHKEGLIFNDKKDE